MSINALVTGCNQKSNRDPLLDLSDLDVEDTLGRLQKAGLTMRIIGAGSRVPRWKHTLYETWHVDKVELAVLAELLLRGPQTEGELRGRASRMEAIDELDTLREVVKRLAGRGLTVYLSPEGRRGTVVTHGFHDPQELTRLRERHKYGAPAAPAAPATPSPMVGALEARLDEAQAEVAALRQEVADLRAALAALTEQTKAIKEGLGI
jgi:uncharacterized protein YceH (UPF0502 family)